MEKKEQVEKRKEEFGQYFKEVGERAEKWVDENGVDRTSLTIIGEDFGEANSTAINACGNGKLLSYAIARQMQEAKGFLRIVTDALSFYGKLKERDQEEDQEDSEEDKG